MAKQKKELIYGIHAVESALQHSCESVLGIWMQQGRKDQKAQGIMSLAQRHGISVEAISSDKMNKKCPDANHQGVIANIRSTKKMQWRWKIF